MTDPKKLTEDEAVELTGRISGLAGSGLPLVPGLIALGEEFPPGPLRRSMLDLARAMEAGAPIDEAIRSQGDRLPPQIRGLIVAGLKTGRLGELLGRFSAYAAVGTELRRRLRFSLIYPVLSVGVAFAIFTFVCTALVPQFEAIFRDFGIPLPVITLILLEASHVFARAWPVLLAFAIGCATAWFAGRLLAAPLRRSLAGRLPIAGAVWRSASLAEFFHLLALLLEGDVPLPEAVRLAGDGSRNSDLSRAGEVVAREVESGRGLADAMASAPLFPRGFGLLLRWAEKPGSLPEVLHMMAEMLEARARSQLTFAASFAALLSIVLILWGAVMVIFGLMLPMISLLHKLSG